MVGVRGRPHFVPLGLTGLGEKDERSSIRGLEAEGKVQEDEGILVEMDQRQGVDHNPEDYDGRLADEILRRPEEAGEALGDLAKGIDTEDGAEVGVGLEEPKRVVAMILLHLSPF